MYDKIEISDVILETADKFVLENDRAQYDIYMRTVEEYCAQNDVVVGGINGIKMLIGDTKLDRDGYSLDLYIDNTFEHARNLADRLYSVGKTIPMSTYVIDNVANTISVESKIKHKYFLIWVNNRILIRMLNLDKHRGVDPAKLISFVSANGRWRSDVKILCIGAEVQLIGVYQQLYNPYPPSPKTHYSYSELLEKETALYKLIEGRLETMVVGGDDNNACSGVEIDLDVLCYNGGRVWDSDDTSVISGGRDKPKVYRAEAPRQHNDVGRICDRILSEIGHKYIIVGDYAINALFNLDTKWQRLQMLCDSKDQKALEDILTKMVRRLLGDRYSVISVMYDLKIPGDRQLLKWTFYLVSKSTDSQQAMFDMFNSISYEAVPYKMMNVASTRVKIANEFVLMRFKLIDLYATRLILGLAIGKNTGTTFITGKIRDIINSISMMRSRTLDNIRANPFNVFIDKQTNDRGYLGVYIDENVMMKKLASSSRQIFTKYYPHLKVTKKEPLSDAEEIVDDSVESSLDSMESSDEKIKTVEE
jgi:hypothetical protein